MFYLKHNTHAQSLSIPKVLPWFGQIPVVSYRLNDRLFHRLCITKSPSLQYSQLCPSLLYSACYYKVYYCACSWLYKIYGHGCFSPGEKQTFELLEKSLRVYVFLEIMLSQANWIKRYSTINKNYLNSETKVKETLYINKLRKLLNCPSFQQKTGYAQKSK